MAYSTEQLAKDLKAAREAKGLSQRALSELAGLPQSHISKIENGGVDLRVSSLVEITRALDLEMTFVPRKNLSAVRSITRPRPPVTQDVAAAVKGAKELKRLQNTIAKISHENPAVTEIAQLQRRINDLNQLKLPTSAVEQMRKINESLKVAAATSETLRKITESLNQVQQLRNQLVHSQAKILNVQKIRPAYSLEDDDHG